MELLFNQAVESLHSLLMACRLAHWNVDGVDFYHYHLLFERLYKSLDEKVDGFVEQGRWLGVEIKAEVFNKVPEVEWGTPDGLCEELFNLNGELIEALSRLREECEGVKMLGLVAVVEDLLISCGEVGYLLGSVKNSR